MSGGSGFKVSEFPVLPAELAVFRPSNLILRDSEAVFVPLHAASMTVAQKNFFAAQCIGEFKEGDINIRLGDSGNELMRRYSLPKGTVGDWKKNVKDGKPNYDTRGRPEALDEQGKMDFLAEVAAGTVVVTGTGQKKRSAKALMIGSEIAQCASKHARFTQARAGKIVDVEDMEVVLHEDTIEKIKKVSMCRFVGYVYIFVSVCNLILPFSPQSDESRYYGTRWQASHKEVTKR
jgi:hypothetical protein